MENFETFKITTLRSKSKDELINHIEDLYRGINQILEALKYIESDIDLIKSGNAFLVHDNP